VVKHRELKPEKNIRTTNMVYLERCPSLELLKMYHEIASFWNMGNLKGRNEYTYYAPE
jgi:hypothetical protein